MAIQVTEIDLQEPQKAIYVDTRYSWLFVVVRWGYYPLGMLRLQCTPESRVWSAEKLQTKILETLGWQLWEQAISGNLQDLDSITEDNLPPISVIVCTRDRPASLTRCLQALAQIDYPHYEVIVVDNCSRNSQAAEIAKSRNLRYVREDTPGLDWARNRGVAQARYDIVAFIDDDALASPGWLRGITRAFADPEIMIVTGLVLPAEMETPAQNDFERYGGMSKGFTAYTIQSHQLNRRTAFRASDWGVGTNMAFRRSLFKTLGGFDVTLDVGTPTNGGGDIEFLYRSVSAGYTLRYQPAALVYHVHRRDDVSLVKQIYNNGRSFGAYLMTIARNQPQKRLAILRFMLQEWMWSWLLKRLLHGLIHRDRWLFAMALTELRGSLSAPRAYSKSQQIAQQYITNAST